MSSPGPSIRARLEAAAEGFEPPADWTRVLVIDAHTAGEPLRVVMAGFPSLEGDTILARRATARSRFDFLRTALMWEPRGHADMYGCLVVPPVTEDGDLGVLFTHNDGYSTMCGHGIIAVATVLVNAPLTAPDADAEVRHVEIAAADVLGAGEPPHRPGDCLAVSPLPQDDDAGETRGGESYLEAAIFADRASARMVSGGDVTEFDSVELAPLLRLFGIESSVDAVIDGAAHADPQDLFAAEGRLTVSRLRLVAGDEIIATDSPIVLTVDKGAVIVPVADVVVTRGHLLEIDAALTHLFIDGEPIDLGDDHQSRLYRRYRARLHALQGK